MKHEHTFLPLPPPPRFFCPVDLNPFTSSSSTIDGGFTFFPHPCDWDSSTAAEEDAVGSSVTRTGAAETIAVAERVALGGSLAVDVNAPSGTLDRPGLPGAFPFPRRVGANARAADHPIHRENMSQRTSQHIPLNIHSPGLGLSASSGAFFSSFSCSLGTSTAGTAATGAEGVLKVTGAASMVAAPLRPDANLMPP